LAQSLCCDFSYNYKSSKIFGAVKNKKSGEAARYFFRFLFGVQKGNEKDRYRLRRFFLLFFTAPFGDFSKHK